MNRRAAARGYTRRMLGGPPKARGPAARLARFAALATLAVLSHAAAAPDALPSPSGPVILSVSGAIDRTNVDGRADFDRAMLASLGMHELVTTTPWTEGPQTFRGVLVSTLLERVGCRCTALHAYALNDYTAVLPVHETRQYPVLLALEHNGKPMRIRDKGPIWIIYPQDQHPELRTRDILARWVWQLRRLEAK